MCRNLAIGLGLGLLLWSGCGVTTDREEPDGLPDARDLLDAAAGPERITEAGIARLSRFESEAEFEAYFKGQILAQADRFEGFAFDFGLDNDAVFDLFEDDFGTGVDFGDDIASDAGGAVGGDVPAQADPGFSGTTLQERGVDEADVVKTDGRYLYILPVTWDIWNEDDTVLQIVQAAPADELAVVSTFPVNGWAGGVYLAGDRAVALTWRFELDALAASGLDFGSIGFFLAALCQLADAEDGEPDEGTAAIVRDFLDLLLSSLRPQTIVTIIDVADPADPKLISETSLDGVTVSSRMIDGKLHLVLTEDVGLYAGLLPLDAREVQVLADLIDPDVLLPGFVTTDASGEVRDGKVVAWDDFVRPADPDGFGMTTVITMDTSARGDFEALAVLADPGLIYASAEALYVTDTEWAWSFDRRRVDTDIYKFAFGEDGVELVGAGTVPGRILNQYSMGEYEGYLRVATTTDELFDWETGDAFPSTNAVYVLG
ncbi:MAG: hypothetical protein GY778_28975, partial [bacterium]|nr:hypothetical protein [bacterium]